MKAAMKRLTSIRGMFGLVLVLLIVLGSALAEPARDPVKGTGWALATGDTAVGQAALVIRGEVQPLADVTVTLAITFISDEGVIHATSSHLFDFGDANTFTTEDKVVAEPTETPGLFVLNEKLRVVSGTGDFENVTGNLTVHGQMQYISATDALVSYVVRGAISR